MHPKTDPLVIQERATIIAGMIEGLMVVIGDTQNESAASESLLNYAFDTALAIADGHNQ